MTIVCVLYHFLNIALNDHEGLFARNVCSNEAAVITVYVTCTMVCCTLAPKHGTHIYEVSLYNSIVSSASLVYGRRLIFYFPKSLTSIPIRGTLSLTSIAIYYASCYYRFNPANGTDSHHLFR